MNKSLDYPQPIQSSPNQIKARTKSWKGVVLIRKSPRLNKDNTPWIIETKILDDESYHKDSEDNNSYEEETLENITLNLEDESQITLYHPKRPNDWNLTEGKIRLFQQFIGSSEVFYRFAKDPNIAYSLHYIYEFLNANKLMSTIRASLPETNNDTKKHVKFYVPHHSHSILKVIKPNCCKPSPSLMLVEYFKSHELVIQEEINDVHSNEEVINFDEESDEESKIELKIDLIAQKFVNAYPYWSDREKEIKEIGVRKVISINSYQ